MPGFLLWKEWNLMKQNDCDTLEVNWGGTKNIEEKKHSKIMRKVNYLDDLDAFLVPL